MAEYIDHWKLLKRISITKCDKRTTACEVCDKKEFCVYSVVEKFPAADVAPVVHGRWEDGQLCSVCDFDRSYFRPHFNYCPNCGARMDGEKP